MIIRIVQLHFKKEHIQAFQKIFERQKTHIASFDGCTYLELLQSTEDQCLFTTYSHWVNADALEAYRHSDFFKNIWTEVKRLFDKKPHAWSYQRIG